MKKAPVWSFDGKAKGGITDQMKQREQAYADKVNNFMSSKNLKPSDIEVDVFRSENLIRKRGRYPFKIIMPTDYTNEEHYKKAREEHPSFSPEPTAYWQMKPNSMDTNTKPPAPEMRNINGKDVKFYYLNHRRTDCQTYKPMRKSVF
ncbi:MAG: hypothetical protein MJ252_15110 [archaeon]|nr:hypothetical protein [archaeon]